MSNSPEQGPGATGEAKPSPQSLRISIFGQSLISDWNHGNAHFLRGLVRSLQQLGHEVRFYEEEDNWSLHNLIAECGLGPVEEFFCAFPTMRPITYRYGEPDQVTAWLEDVLAASDVVLVHEWNRPELIRELGQLGRQRKDVTTLFHDTHYRVYTEPESMRALDLENYGAILAFGPGVADIYRRDFGFNRVYVFHEAADARLFRPLERPKTQDAVFIGNWGDNDRNQQLEDYLFRSSAALPQLRFALYGVRYDEEILQRLRDEYRISYRGWVPNHKTPEVYAASKMSLHIPRQQYSEIIYGTPTIRVFEVLSCGLPLVSLPWPDTEHLFSPGDDYVVIHNQAEMISTIRDLANDEAERRRIGAHARATILAGHTCMHRTRQMLEIVDEVRGAR